MKQRFYICATCGKIIAIVNDVKVPTICCGEKMTEIIPGTINASTEKHVPIFKIENNKVYVSVGEAEHPMVEEHYIEWISLQTNFGNQRKLLKPDQKPEVCFAILDGEEVESVYAYCNLHGLWKNEK